LVSIGAAHRSTEAYSSHHYRRTSAWHRTKMAVGSAATTRMSILHRLQKRPRRIAPAGPLT